MVAGKKSIIRRWETQVGIGVAVACFSVLGVFLGLKVGGEKPAAPAEVAQVEEATQAETVAQVEEQPAGIPDMSEPVKEELNPPSETYYKEDESVETEDALAQGPGEAIGEVLEEPPTAEFPSEEMVADEGAAEEGAAEDKVAVGYPKVHTVKPNETLMGLAMEYYGDVSKWVLIYEANGLLNRNRLAVNQSLVIPSPDYVVKQQPVVEKTSLSDRGSPGMAHRVQQGDTLQTLAGVYYNDESQWKRIYDANKGHLSGRETLKPGEVLIIP
ncbi:MAG: LysM peptidoglycan-binding domain-containing protein [Candidatus Brocadiales bacterium]